MQDAQPESRVDAAFGAREKGKVFMFYLALVY